MTTAPEATGRAASHRDARERGASERRVRVTVSVVIPVKDDAALLERCLRALAAQTVAPHEIIVVDNDSSDHSGDVARRAGAILLGEKRPGIAAASETGYDHAQGDVIARLDADTVVASDWIETLQKAFDGRPDVDAVTGAARFLDGPRILRSSAAVVYLGAYFALAGLALAHVPLFGSNFAMRRSAWEQVRGEAHDSDRLHDDFDLSFHLGPWRRIRFLRGLRAEISMRPLYDGRGRLRLARGFRTVAVHWPAELPWLRLARRVASGVRRRRGRGRRAVA